MLHVLHSIVPSNLKHCGFKKKNKVRVTDWQPVLVFSCRLHHQLPFPLIVYFHLLTHIIAVSVASASLSMADVVYF